MQDHFKFDHLFLKLKKVGDYVDIKELDYPNQVYLTVCRFNKSKERNKGRRVKGHKIGKGDDAFFRVFLISK